MDQNIEQIADLLDVALTSDNPAVKEQLQKLLMTAALFSSPDPKAKIQGFFRSILTEIELTRVQVSKINEKVEQMRGISKYDYKDKYEKYEKIRSNDFDWDLPNNINWSGKATDANEEIKKHLLDSIRSSASNSILGKGKYGK
jgi:hypothetical protein